MRENPNVNMDPNDTIFAGDNFERYTGDTNKLAQLQMFAWDSEKRNNSVHMQANPTQAEFLHKQHLNNQQAISGIQQSNILEKYGGAEYLNAPAKELLLAQSEVYTEYSRTGQVIKGVESLIPKSIYQEDVLLFNHTSVFGSYWKDSKWGYKCCHSFLKNSYCVGIQEDSNQTMESIQDNIELFKRTEDPPVDDLKPIELKRKYNSLESSTVTEQELEEYRRSKSKFEYPMKDFV